MTRIETVLYTARSRTRDGHDGACRSADGPLDVKLSLPGASGAGADPEHLFAAGLSACFFGAIGRAARTLEVVLPADTAVEAEVELGTTGYAYLVQTRLKVSLPGLSRTAAEAVVAAARELCPYAKAIRIKVEIARAPGKP